MQLPKEFHLIIPLLIKGSTIGSRVNPSRVIAPSCRIRILLNWSISVTDLVTWWQVRRCII